LIYLDNAATTRLGAAARAALEPWLGERFGNPAALHALGVQAATALEAARRTVARSLGGGPQELTFCSGASEANALAIFGVARRRRKPGHLICSAVEHSSVLESCRALVEREGFRLTELPVDGSGRVAPADVVAALQPDTQLIAIQHSNNEIGTVQPIQAIVRALAQAGSTVPVHCDAVQSYLKLPLDLRRLGVASLAVSGHKVHGPLGVGALLRRPGLHLVPLWGGGSQEGGLRPGTPNLPAIVGLAAAVEDGLAVRAAVSERMATLRDRLQDALVADVPGLRVNGLPGERLPSCLHVSLPGLRSEPLLHALAAQGLYASAGSACHAAQRSPSHVLRAIGVPESQPWAHLRLSLGRETEPEEIELAASLIVQTWHQLT